MELGVPGWVISLLLPVLVGLLGIRASKERARSLAYLSAITLLIPALIVAWSTVALRPGEPIIDPVKFDLTQYKIGTFAFVADGLSIPVILGISIVTAMVAVYSAKYMTVRIIEMEHHGEKVPDIGAYFFLYNTFAVSMLGMSLSTNLVEFYLFLELSLIVSFLLIAYYGYGNRKKISMIYFVWTHVAGALFIAGALYYGVNAGTFDVLRVTGAGNIGYVTDWAATTSLAAKLAAYAILIGLLVKMAVFGVHMWLPYAHAEAPTPVSALLSPNLIGIAGYALARFGLVLFPELMRSIHMYLVGLAFVTIVYGGLVALRQEDFKRFLAYSSVSQMGYLLLGIATLTAYGIGGAMLHYLTHAIGKAVLFMVAGVFITELSGLRDIRKMGGLAKVYPLTAAAALLGFMHLAGMPPTIGIWSELLITLGVVEAIPPATVDNVLLVTVLLIVSFGISAAYAFITMRRIFYGKLRLDVGRGEELDDFKQTVILLGVLGVVLFIIVSLIMTPLQVGAETLVGAVLG